MPEESDDWREWHLRLAENDWRLYPLAMIEAAIAEQEDD